jgi:hypothetical protein
VRKDALAIRSGQGTGELLRAARQIDREFIARLERFPLVRLRIRYEDIEPIRRERIERLLGATRALVAAPWRGIRAAARARYSADQLEALVRKHLRLYAAEVDSLGACVRPRLLVAPFRSRLRALMDERAGALAREVAHLLYDRAMR